MSHFYGSMEGSRGEATRCGTKSSGLSIHARGWRVGARVECSVNTEGQDEVQVFSTSGSNGHSQDRLIASFTAETRPKAVG